MLDVRDGKILRGPGNDGPGSFATSTVPGVGTVPGSDFHWAMLNLYSVMVSRAEPWHAEVNSIAW
jgi:hypothetical protein